MIYQIISNYVETMTTMTDGIETLAAAGTDIEPIYHKLHQPGASLDDDQESFYEAVIVILCDQGLSSQSERNLRYLLGLAKT